MVQELPVHPGGVRQSGEHRRLERAEHASLARRRHYAGARREGNREAGYAAYRSGMVFEGKLDIPVIDWRHYLEHRLDMHNSHQSFAAHASGCSTTTATRRTS